MKLHPELTPQAIVEKMRGEMVGEMRKLRPDGDEFERVSTQEEAEARAALQQFAGTLAGVKFVCVGCESPIEAADAACCECGGFVCPACRASETEGECDHEPPNFPGDAK